MDLSIAPSRYFTYLVDKFLPGFGDYGFLIYALYNKEFYSSVFMDSNREADGLELRNDYFEESETPIEYKIPFNNILARARVLEVLIGLCIRAQTCIDIHNGINRGIFFRIMLENLGLKEFTNEYVVKSGDAVEEIDFILNRFLDRKYNPDGTNGGLFPLRYAKKDLRELELWDQMNAFVIENGLF